MKHKKHLFVILFAMLLMQGCDWEQDVAPMPTFVGEANTTIAELLAMHTIGSEDSYDSIPMGSNIIICGYVTTSDEWGNNYKYLNIEDETGGIQIKIDNKALYNKYKIGQKIFVKCDGLVLGDYRKLPQLGFWANGSMQPIPSFKTYLYLFPDGAPTGGFNPIDMTTIPSANDIPATDYNRRVRLIGATFVEGGIATFSDPGAATSHDIKSHLRQRNTARGYRRNHRHPHPLQQLRANRYQQPCRPGGLHYPHGAADRLQRQLRQCFQRRLEPDRHR